MSPLELKPGDRVVIHYLFGEGDIRHGTFLYRAPGGFAREGRSRILVDEFAWAMPGGTPYSDSAVWARVGLESDFYG